MALTFRKLHPCFAAEVSPVDLKTVHDNATLGRIRAGMDEFAVLVFRDQVWSDAEHLDFAQRLDALRVHHSIAYSRQPLGFEFSENEQEALKGAIHPLVRTIPRSNRRSLYLASPASRIIDWPVPEGRLLLRELIEHATQPRFVYRHQWRVGVLVIWDNLSTMHRARELHAAPYTRMLSGDATL